MAKYLWVYVTDDEYELPIYVCDTVREMAKYIGTKENNISSVYSKYKAGITHTCRFRRVLNESGEEDV